MPKRIRPREEFLDDLRPMKKRMKWKDVGSTSYSYEEKDNEDGSSEEENQVLCYPAKGFLRILQDSNRPMNKNEVLKEYRKRRYPKFTWIRTSSQLSIMFTNGLIGRKKSTSSNCRFNYFCNRRCVSSYSDLQKALKIIQEAESPLSSSRISTMLGNNINKKSMGRVLGNAYRRKIVNRKRKSNINSIFLYFPISGKNSSSSEEESYKEQLSTIERLKLSPRKKYSRVKKKNKVKHFEEEEDADVLRSNHQDLRSIVPPPPPQVTQVTPQVRSKVVEEETCQSFEENMIIPPPPPPVRRIRRRAKIRIRVKENTYAEIFAKKMENIPVLGKDYHLPSENESILPKFEPLENLDLNTEEKVITRTDIIEVSGHRGFKEPKTLKRLNVNIYQTNPNIRLINKVRFDNSLKLEGIYILRRGTTDKRRIISHLLYESFGINGKEIRKMKLKDPETKLDLKKIIHELCKSIKNFLFLGLKVYPSLVDVFYKIGYKDKYNFNNGIHESGTVVKILLWNNFEFTGQTITEEADPAFLEHLRSFFNEFLGMVGKDRISRKCFSIGDLIGSILYSISF